MKTSRKAGIASVALAVSGLALSALALSGSAFAQSESASGSGGTPLVQLIEGFSKKSGKTFILDPRIAGSAVMVGLDPSKITYAELLAVLQVQGFAAIESGGMVRVVPDTAARTSPSPVIGGNDKYPESQVVTRILRVKSVPAAQLVPILRPLLPQSAHLAAFTCTNEILIVDTFANVRRIETIVSSMDKGNALTLPECRLDEPRFFTPPAPSPPNPPK